jgi:hypothetical protein
MNRICTRILVCLALAAAATLLSGLPFASAQEEAIVLDMGGPSDQRPAVAFDHGLHMGLFECLDCHHQIEDGVNVLDEDDLTPGNPDVRCLACHAAADADIDLQKAYHRQCMGCHIDTRKTGEPSGPELCGSCHIPVL